MDFRELVKVGAHFGHIKSRLNPKMLPYIWGIKNNVYLIDVSKTAYLINKAAKFLEGVAAEGKSILWVGTKKPASAAIKAVAEKLHMPYVNNRWIGGTLSNYSQVKKSVTKLLHYEDILSKTEKFPYYTKKELNVFTKIVERLKKNIGGIVDLKWPIGAVVLVDVVKELSALKEAATVGVPVVAMVDTNGDPTLVDYVIPANDDSVKTVKLVIDYLGDYVAKGQLLAKEAKKEAQKEEKAKSPAKPTVKKEKEKKAPAKAVVKKAEKKSEDTKKETPAKAKKTSEPKPKAQAKTIQKVATKETEK